MSRAFEEIKEGLEDAVEFSKGIKSKVKVYKPKPVNVKLIRAKLDMTQEIFAATFGISLGTLRHWERGDRTPRGAALTLLNVVDRAPNAVLNAIMS